MSNIKITNVDLGNVILANGRFDDDTLTAPGGAKTYAEGTMLARNTASQKLVPLNPAGSGGDEIPISVLTQELVVDAPGTTDVQIRPLLAGEVRRERLVIDAGGTVTQAIVDQLKDQSIVAISVQELALLDNQ